jgi:hypothetical protein
MNRPGVVVYTCAPTHEVKIGGLQLEVSLGKASMGSLCAKQIKFHKTASMTQMLEN